MLLRHVERLRLGLYHRYAPREAEARLPAASHLGPMVRALRAAATAARHVLVVGDPVRPTAATAARLREPGGAVAASRTHGRQGQGLPWACVDCAAMQSAHANEGARSPTPPPPPSPSPPPPPPPLASSQRLAPPQDTREEEELMAAEAAARGAGVGVECLQLALDSLSCGLTLRQWLEHVVGRRAHGVRHNNNNRLLVGYAQWIARCWRQPRREVALLPASAHLQPSAVAAGSAVRRLLNSSLLEGSSPVGLEVLARGCARAVPHEACGC